MRIIGSMALAAVALVSVSVAAATVVPVGEFHSIRVNGGGHVVVRHGAVQRVSVAEGDVEISRVRVGSDGALVIDRAVRECPRGYRLQIEIVTPRLSAVSVSNGGTVQTLGDFPAQESIEAAVEQGGTIDIRSVAADRVDAFVDSGGRIFATARERLGASVRSGGAITYWGDPRDVARSIRNGGVVTQGMAEDAVKPLSELGPRLPALPPIPPLPPVPR